MFCDGCGGAMVAGQAFCSRCGKQMMGPITSMQFRPGRVQTHTHLLGIMWLAISAFNTLGGVILLILANTLFVRYGANPHTSFLRPLLTVVAIFILAKAVSGFLAGWGLLQREPWARSVALILGFLSLFNVPFGTAVGIYTLWVMLPAQSQQEYAQLADQRAAA